MNGGAQAEANVLVLTICLGRQLVVSYRTRKHCGWTHTSLCSSAIAPMASFARRGTASELTS